MREGSGRWAGEPAWRLHREPPEGRAPGLCRPRTPMAEGSELSDTEAGSRALLGTSASGRLCDRAWGCQWGCVPGKRGNSGSEVVLGRP